MTLKAEQHYSDEWLVYDDDTYDGPGSVIGSGRTRREAVVNFLEYMNSEPLQTVLEAIYVATH